jgi:hypothetical protein
VTSDPRVPFSISGIPRVDQELSDVVAQREWANTSQQQARSTPALTEQGNCRLAGAELFCRPLFAAALFESLLRLLLL